MKNKFLLLYIFLTAITSLQAQLHISPELNASLSGKKTFKDIMQSVTEYYTQKEYHKDPLLYSEFKKWNRWAWYAVRHLNDAGEVDYKTRFYFEETQRMQEQVLPSQPNSNSGVWSFIGPVTTAWANNIGSKGIGRVDRLAFSPFNANIILAATPAGGLWRTNDAGLNWFSISANLPNCGISGVLFGSEDPSGNTIYILTGDGDTGPVGSGAFVSNYGFLRTSIGVLVTYNGGNTWQKSGNSETAFTGRRCYKLLQVRNSENVFLAATDNGIYSSTDFGQNWAQSSLSGNSVFDIEQHPTADNIIYAALVNTVRKSSDGGQTFAINPTFSPEQSVSIRSAITVCTAAPNDVYFLQCDNSYNRIYKSSNSGDSYTSINSTNLITGQYSYNCSFAVNPQNSSFLVAGGINISSSADNGLNFGNTTIGIITGPPGSTYVHPDIHDLAYHPVNNTLYAATDGGVFMSTNNGVNWADRSNGLRSTQYYHMDGFNGTANLLIGGAQDNGTAYTTNGATMNYCGTGDGFAVDFVNGDNNVFYQVENSNVFRFTRSTNTRVNISPGVAANQTFYPNIISHPTNNNIVYVGYANSIWRSNNQGAPSSWTNISPNGTSNGGSGHTGGFAVSPNLPDRLYAANANTVWRSDDQGNNWIPISGNSGWPVNFGVITDIATRNNNANELLIVTTGSNGTNKMFYTNDAGANWFNYTGSLPNVPVYSVVYTNEGDTYIGTELGVYFMDFDMTDWVPFYNGLPMVPITDLFVNETLGSIQASSFGRGIWQSDLYSNCSPLLLLSDTALGAQFYQSSGVIESSQVIPGSFGNSIKYRGQSKVILENGFRAFKGSSVKAIIGICGQGVMNMPVSDSVKVITKAENLQRIKSSLNQD